MNTLSTKNKIALKLFIDNLNLLRLLIEFVSIICIITLGWFLGWILAIYL